eukprot:38457-Chlamydomonas_euryale.AAC.9
MLVLPQESYVSYLAQDSNGCIAAFLNDGSIKALHVSLHMLADALVGLVSAIGRRSREGRWWMQTASVVHQPNSGMKPPQAKPSRSAVDPCNACFQ